MRLLTCALGQLKVTAEIKRRTVHLLTLQGIPGEMRASLILEEELGDGWDRFIEDIHIR